MTLKYPARRRFIHISACYGGAALLTGLGIPGRKTHASTASTIHTAQSTHSWTGIALGADASLQITHPDAQTAQELIERCVAEVRRLESLFSLYRDDSAISLLNQQGYLDNPSSDFLTLLDRSKEFSRLTHGTFDITVQPLWQAYADHFTANNNHTSRAQTPETSRSLHGTARTSDLDAVVQDTLKRVDWRKLDISTQQVRLQQPGMAITLNGIAQGYITDRVTQLLATQGIDHALVNMGEIYGLNPASDEAQHPWQVGLENARQPGSIINRIPIHNRAIATSGAYGTPFTPDMRYNHLIDPRNGKSSHRYRSVSVVAADATTADALSTAFSLMPETTIRELSKELDIHTYIQAGDEAVVRQV